MELASAAARGHRAVRGDDGDGDVKEEHDAACVIGGLADTHKI